MAGLAETIDIAQLPAWLEKAQRALDTANWQPALKGCRLVIIGHTKGNFAAGKSPQGATWAPLKHRSGKPLRDKGLLMASVTASGAAGNVETITDSTLTFGTNLDYASIHQRGGTITPKGAKALAIPVTNEARRSGGPRRMGDLNLVWPKGKPSGTLRDTAGKTHWILVKSVTVPARPFLGWTDEMASECGEIVAEHGEKVIASVR